MTVRTLAERAGKDKPMEDRASFGAWLKQRRKALDLTQAELAQQAGCALGTIRKIEADERRPSKQLAALLADQLAIPSADHAAFLKVARAELSVFRLAPFSQPDDQRLPRSLEATLVAQLPLPVPPTTLIGREHELADVRTLLQRADVRLVTLTGPGGIGKTRVGLQMAAELIDDFPDGVYFVDLAPIPEPTLVISAIAQTLGIRETGGQPLLTQLKQFLGDKRLLLLLDNFEHLLDAAPLVAELLAGAAWLKVLATSRERLHLRGEKEVAVPPLALPDQGNLPPLDQLSHSAAVALFRARAVDTRSDFQLTNANATSVAEICVRLDGLPLAIELAAARVKLFTPEALLTRLSSRLTLLTGGARDLPLRQQTIRATIDWSYHLLDGGEQVLFARLGVFVGSWTLEAAEAVCHGENDLSVGVVDGMATLVNQSLVKQQESSAGEARFTMLETLREYALERLEANGEAEPLRRQHARYYLTLGEALYPPPGPWHPARTAALDRDYDNLWSALAWSQTAAGDSELALQLTGALRILWFHRGMQRQAIAALERALSHPQGVGRTLAHAIARFELGQFLAHMGDYVAARLQFEQTLQLAREVGDRWWYAVAVEWLGWLAREQGDSVSAWARLSESIAILRELGNTPSMADIAENLYMLAEVAILEEDEARAEALLAECRAIEQREHNIAPNVIGWTLLSLGHAAQLRGAYDDAAELHQESLAFFRLFGDQHVGLPWTYHGLGETALGQGRLGEAGRHLAQGLALSQTLGDQASIAWCLAGLGSTAALNEQPERAARVWGAAEQLRQAIGCRSAPAARAIYERALATAHAQLGEEAFATAWERGRAMTVEQAIAEALQTTP